jgi:hypothetical protein
MVAIGERCCDQGTLNRKREYKNFTSIFFRFRSNLSTLIYGMNVMLAIFLQVASCNKLVSETSMFPLNKDHEKVLTSILLYTFDT